MAIFTRKEQLPLRDQLIADRLEFSGLPYRYDSEYNLKLLEHEPAVQVRRDPTSVPASEVLKYMEAMRNGAQFPAGVITRDRRRVDMNTRLAAYLKLGITRAPVFIIQEDWGPDDAVLDDRLRHVRAKIWAFGARINREHGKRLPDKDTRHAVEYALRDGFTVEAAMQEFQESRSYINNIANEVKAKKRAERLGIPEQMERINATARQALGTADVPQDDDWRDLVLLAYDAGLSDKEIRQVVTDLKAQPTAQERHRLLVDERAKRAAQINDEGARRSGLHTQLPGQLRRNCGFLIKHAKEEHLMVERNASLRQSHLDMLEEALLALQGYVQAQRELMEQEAPV